MARSSSSLRPARTLPLPGRPWLWLTLVLLSLAQYASAAEYKSGLVWPEPKVIDPGPPGGPPSDATVLFDGKDLSKWVGGEKWTIKDGYAIAAQTSIKTKQVFGDCQLHIEWATPDEVKGESQGRGNSGVFFFDKYEVQILDSYKNETYFDGQAASIYKQQPPMVNACRKPGEWQTYDILFTVPRFDADGELLRPGYVTVLHNGVAVQNHFELKGDTSYIRAPMYQPHPPKGPIQLQYHNNPVKFRNIWIREIKALRPLPTSPFGPKAATPADKVKPEKKGLQKPKAAAEKPKGEKAKTDKAVCPPAKPGQPQPEKPRPEKPKADVGKKMVPECGEKVHAEIARPEKPRAARPAAEKPKAAPPVAEKPAAEKPKAEKPQGK